MVDASYSGNCRSRWDTCYRSRWYTCWNLAGPQRITAFKPPYFADRYIENIWMAANKAGKEHRLGRKRNRSKNPNRISTSTNRAGGLWATACRCVSFLGRVVGRSRHNLGCRWWWWWWLGWLATATLYSLVVVAAIFRWLTDHTAMSPWSYPPHLPAARLWVVFQGD